MKLIDLVSNIDDIDEESIIFIENKENLYSDIIISFSKENDKGIKIKNGKKYYYLIEVFLAKEFIQDWAASSNYTATSEQTAKRLYEYAINDA